MSDDFTARQRLAYHRSGRSMSSAKRERLLNEADGSDPTIVNALAYGAIPGTGDVTARLQEAVTAAAGKVLLIPAGTYTISGALTSTDSIRVVGDGSDKTIITSTNSSADIFSCPTTTDYRTLRFEHLQLVGGRDSIHWGGGAATAVQHDSSVVDCVLNPTRAGLYSTVTMTGCKFYKITVAAGAQYGVFVLRDNALNATCFDSLIVSQASVAGFYANVSGTDDVAAYGTACEIVGASAFQYNAVGIHVRNQQLTVRNCHFEGNGVGGNGTTIIYPDVDIYTNYNAGPSSGICQVTLDHCLFSSTTDTSQAHKRIRLNNPNSRLLAFQTIFQAGSTDVIDGVSAAYSEFIAIDCIGSAPTISNFGGTQHVIASGSLLTPQTALTMATGGTITQSGGAVLRGGTGAPAGGSDGDLYQRAGVSVLRHDGGSWCYPHQFPGGVVYLDSTFDKAIFTFPNPNDGHATSPEGYQPAPPGAICTVNIAGTAHFYVKKTGTGNTGWSEIALP